VKNNLLTDNPIVLFLTNFFNLLTLNALFLISCIPLVTIGAALTALHSVVLQMLKDEDPSIWKSYWHAFRQNFRPATMLFAIVLAGGLFLGNDLYIIYKVIDHSWMFLQVPVWILLFLVLALYFYGFPLLASYECSFRQLLKNVFLLAVGNFPTSLFLIVVHLLLLRFALHSSLFLTIVFSLLLFIGFAALACFCDLFLLRIFRKCENMETTAKSNG
jgi:uncharacterized membrane protein YesL